MKFKIKLKAAHDKTGLTFYAVAKQTGIASNTVQKYADVDVIVSDVIPTTVIRLAQFYGVDWKDPSVIEIVEEESDEENQNALLATA